MVRRSVFVIVHLQVSRESSGTGPFVRKRAAVESARSADGDRLTDASAPASLPTSLCTSSLRLPWGHASTLTDPLWKKVRVVSQKLAVIFRVCLCSSVLLRFVTWRESRGLWSWKSLTPCDQRRSGARCPRSYQTDSAGQVECRATSVREFWGFCPWRCRTRARSSKSRARTKGLVRCSSV